MPRTRAAHHHLGRMLTGRHAPGEYHWHHVMGALHVVAATRTARHEAVLRRAAVATRPLAIHHGAGLPHALPPEEMVRSIAVQTLGRWDARAHADVLHHVARTAEHDVVARIARAALSG